jgi:hypothetical protein
VADETAAKEAVHTVLTAAQMEFAKLEQTAVSVCQELEGEGAVSGSSVISHLRARRSDCRTRQEHLPPRCLAGSRRSLDALPHGSPEGVVGVRHS